MIDTTGPFLFGESSGIVFDIRGGSLCSGISEYVMMMSAIITLRCASMPNANAYGSGRISKSLPIISNLIFRTGEDRGFDGPSVHSVSIQYGSLLLVKSSFPGAEVGEISNNQRPFEREIPRKSFTFVHLHPQFYNKKLRKVSIEKNRGRSSVGALSTITKQTICFFEIVCGLCVYKFGCR